MFSFVKKSHFSFFWLLSSIGLLVLARVFSSVESNYTGGIYYILFTLFYALIVFIFFRKAEDMASIPTSVFCLGVGILALGEPLFENDHYRYLWEGKVVFSGGNPYRYAPISRVLEDLSFSVKDKIAFNQLTTIYPPLALIWFGLGGYFDFPIGLFIMVLLNSLIVVLIYQKLRFRLKPWYMLILFPWVQKEFIQAIHIDLLAGYFFLLWLLSFHRCSLRKQAWLLGLSIWTKVLALVALPIFLLQRRYKLGARLLIFLLLLISLPTALYWLSGGFETLNGAYNFGEYWVWNPGFYAFLTRGLSIPGAWARQVSFGFYVFYLLLVGLGFLYLFKKEGERVVLVYWLFYLVFAGLMFFTPVYNAWYAIWFVLPALLLKLNTGVWYAVFSVWCYTFHGSPELIVYAGFMSHVWFILSLVEGARTSSLRCSWLHPGHRI